MAASGFEPTESTVYDAGAQTTWPPERYNTAMAIDPVPYSGKVDPY